MLFLVMQVWKVTFLRSKNGTWTKSYRTRFLSSKSEKLKHIFWSVCAIIKESNQEHSFWPSWAKLSLATVHSTWGGLLEITIYYSDCVALCWEPRYFKLATSSNLYCSTSTHMPRTLPTFCWYAANKSIILWHLTEYSWSSGLFKVPAFLWHSVIPVPFIKQLLPLYELCQGEKDKGALLQDSQGLIMSHSQGVVRCGWKCFLNSII